MRDLSGAAVVDTGRMLHELRVENLLLLERAELRLAPGPERADRRDGRRQDAAGARARPAARGQGAQWDRPRRGRRRRTSRVCSRSPPALAGDERIPDGAEELVLARRVWPDGRTRAYVCGRSATVADLRELGGRMLSFYGQHEHRKLMLDDRSARRARRVLRPGAVAASGGRRGRARARSWARGATLRARRARRRPRSRA